MDDLNCVPGYSMSKQSHFEWYVRGERGLKQMGVKAKAHQHQYPPGRGVGGGGIMSEVNGCTVSLPPAPNSTRAPTQCAHIHALTMPYISVVHSKIVFLFFLFFSSPTTTTT